MIALHGSEAAGLTAQGGAATMPGGGLAPDITGSCMTPGAGGT